MNIPLRISFKNIPPSDAVAADIKEWASKLDRFYGRITGCRVVVEAPNHRHRQGTLYRVRIFLSVPGGEIAVGRDRGLDHAHEDVYVAVRDAFLAAKKQMQEYVGRSLRFERHVSARPAHGRVVKLEYEGGDDGYGFLETTDGREVYFNRNSVLNGGFDELKVGAEVRFDEETGEEGPQASTVEVVGREGQHRFA